MYSCKLLYLKMKVIFRNDTNVGEDILTEVEDCKRIVGNIFVDIL